MRSDQFFTHSKKTTIFMLCMGAALFSAPTFATASADNKKAAPIRYATAQSSFAPQTGQVNERTQSRNQEYVGGKPFDPRAAAARLASKPVSEPQRVPPRNLAFPTNTSSEPAVSVSLEENTTRTVGTGFSPVSSSSYDATGAALIYNSHFFGEPTASGEVLMENALSAAHPSLPIPSLVQVVNTRTGREIVVRVNDRGPFDDDGLIELTPRAANLLGITKSGASEVRVRYLGPAETKPRLVAANEPAPAPTEPTIRQKIVEMGMAPIQKANRSPVTEPTLPVAVPDLEPQSKLTLDMAPKGEANFFVQAGSFGQFDNAVAFRERLMVKHNVGIVKVNVRGRDYFRVLVGPFDYKQTAVETRAKLKRDGIDAIVIPAEQ